MDFWSVRILREKIGKMLYERTVISQEPEGVIQDSLNLVKSENEMSSQLIFTEFLFY